MIHPKVLEAAKRAASRTGHVLQVNEAGLLVLVVPGGARGLLLDVVFNLFGYFPPGTVIHVEGQPVTFETVFDLA